MKLSPVLQTFGALAVRVGAASAPTPTPDPEIDAFPATVNAPAGSIVGGSFLYVESFRGIPFAEPPTGPLHLKPPKRFESTLDNFNARGLAASCPQMVPSDDIPPDLPSEVLDRVRDLPLLKRAAGQEDCLTISVQRPAGVKEGDKLPVLFWIFGGGFQIGGTSAYDATSLLSFARLQDQPFIFVAVNYRVAGFGFMPGAEILADGSANLGLLDQRMGLEWVADNIAAFGGDPDKVTIWGESAGSISVFDQMALYGGNASYNNKPLFRGAIMNSGSMAPADPVDSPKAQAIYNHVVDRAGCANDQDTLVCLRKADYDTFLDAANSFPSLLSYASVASSYTPRPDGKALPDSPEVLAADGRYYAVPMIIGDQEDEGTVFALFQSNISTTTELATYLHDYFFPSATVEELTTLVNTYSPDKSEGSPFRTGDTNEWYPGFKRLAAILGDLIFTLTRRGFLGLTAAANPDVPSWSYLASYDHGTPILGTFHGSDIIQVFYGQFPNNAARSSRTYYYNFLYNLDPNVGVTDYAEWPEWKTGRELMWFENANENSLLADDFRAGSAQWIADNASRLRV